MDRKRSHDDSDSDDAVNDVRELMKRSRKTTPPAVNSILNGRPTQRLDVPSYAGLTASSYTVAWICAIPCELAAARAMLDETHPPLPDQPEHDSNHYTLGAIYQHNVVIACLPVSQYGTTNAANVLTNLTRTFPSIRVCLMVGVGGGVPSPHHDIRLGDVVVGIRVMPYELGKVGADGEIKQISGCLMPHPSLSTLLSTIRAKHESEPSQMTSIIEERFSSQADYRRPTLPDRLFEAAYDHVASRTLNLCDSCDDHRLVRRPTRKSTAPEIHYGAIGSGDKLIKHGSARDQLAQKLDVICFEMEAAGLMNILPCLPIRGICDYSDSHKNKDWQRYAAATAASYAREILESLPMVVRQGSHHQPVELSEEADSDDRDILREQRKQLMLSLDFPQLDTRRQTIKQAHAKTCQWLLQIPEYKQWHDPTKYAEHRGFLWIRGKPGVGKSTMMKFLFDKARKSDRRKTSLSISFFFNARGDTLEKSVSGMYRSLLLQLLSHFTDLQDVLGDPSVVPRTRDYCPPVDVLKDLFQTAIFRLGHRSLTCFVDALDEGDEQQIIEMVQFFEDIAEQSAEKGIRFRTCLSSRHYPYIDVKYGVRLALEDQVGHADDLSDYIRGNLRVKDVKLLADLETQLVEKSRGVFLWIKLVVDILNAENRRGRLALKKRLAEIPAGLGELFRDMLTRDSKNMGDLLLSITWILFAKRPLSPFEYHHAIWAGLATTDDADEDMPDVLADDAEDCAQMCVLSSSKGLAEITRSSKPTVQFIHESVRDYLIRDKGLHELWPNIGLDWEAQCHENLKHYCKFYLQHRQAGEYIRDQMGNIAVLHFQESRRIVEVLPLLAYASQHVLYHADAAVPSFPHQEQCLSLFSPVDWTRLLDMHERYKVREYTRNASLLYILADCGLSNLIRIRMRTEPPHKMEAAYTVPKPRYKYALFAALAKRHEDVVAAFLGLQSCPSSYLDAASSLDLKNDSTNAAHWNLSPLSWAVSEGLLDLVSLLLKQGFETNGYGPHALEPFYFAMHAGNHEAAELLLRYGANPSQEGLACGLDAAVKSGNEKLTELLIRSGVDFNKADHLYAAFFYGHEQVAELMTAAGARLLDLESVHLFRFLGPKRWKKNIKMMTRVLVDKEKDSDTRRHNGQMLLFLLGKLGLEPWDELRMPSGVDFNVRNIKGETPLIVASRNRNLDMVRFLLKNGADVEVRNSVNETALFLASQQRYTPVVLELLKTGGADVMTAYTPLHTAVEFDYLNTVRHMLDSGTSVDTRNSRLRTPLHVAASGSTMEIVKLLLARGASVEALEMHRMTPLHLACQHGQEDIAKLLIENGSNIHARDSSNRTPLHLAPESERGIHITSLLLNHGSYVRTTDKTGSTPLHVACEHGQRDVVKLLLDRGSDAHAKDNNEQTPLHFFSKYGTNVHKPPAKTDAEDESDHLMLQKASQSFSDTIVDLLLKHKADINAKDAIERTPLRWASERGNYAMVLGLLDQCIDTSVKVNIEAKDRTHQTPLHVASAAGHVRIVRLLIDRGAEIATWDNSQQSPLCLASMKGRKEVAELLLDRGANVNAKPFQAKSALHLACMEGHEEVVRLLIERGADVHARNKLDDTPLQVARKATGSNKVITRLLIENGADS